MLYSGFADGRYGPSMRLWAPAIPMSWRRGESACRWHLSVNQELEVGAASAHTSEQTPQSSYIFAARIDWLQTRSRESLAALFHRVQVYRQLQTVDAKKALT